MKPRLQLKMLLIQIILEWKVSMNEKNEVKAFFQVSLQIHEWFFSPKIAKDVYLRFSSIIWFLQYSSHFLFLTEARSILISFYTKSTLQPVCVHAPICFPQFTKIDIQKWYYFFRRNHYYYYYYYHCYNQKYGKCIFRLRTGNTNCRSGP